MLLVRKKKAPPRFVDHHCSSTFQRQRYDLCSRIHRFWLGDKVNSGKGLSYWHAMQALAGRYDNPMPELTLSPGHLSMNSATGRQATKAGRPVRHPYARVNYIPHSGDMKLATTQYLNITSHGQSLSSTSGEVFWLVILRNFSLCSSVS